MTADGNREDVQKSIHRTVLLNETIEGLNLKGESPTVLDATFGGGGHSFEICRRFPSSKIIAFDQDKSVWKKAELRFKGCDIKFVTMNFRDIDPGSVGELDGIIFDLGLSSDQLENSGRGFSFKKDEPLFMTMKEDPKEEDLTASDIVNTWSEENLGTIIRGYGEERYAKRIAHGIAEARKEKKLDTTFDLVRAIEKSVPAVYRRGRIHFATRTFQAIRIAVNSELEALQEGLKKGFEALKPGGRMAVISFHSLEDRITKRFFKNLHGMEDAKLVNKKPILAKEEETNTNPRSRSAKLRILEKI